MQLVLPAEHGPFNSRIFGLVPDDPKRTMYTPLFIPSFSSTVDPNWLRTAKGLARAMPLGLVLVSAFDVARATPSPPRRLNGFGGVVLDSGGYESRRLERPWPQKKFAEIVSAFRADIVVGYDLPNEPVDAVTQIRRQVKGLEAVRKGTLRTVLLHSDLDESIVPDVVACLAKHASAFDIVGLTEKALGASFPSRARAVHRLRRSMDEEGLVRPIHLFGADDPLSLVIYSAAGADLFDGLAWSTDFVNTETMTRHDVGHASMCPAWRSFAKKSKADLDDPHVVLGLTLEWNLARFDDLMAGIRHAVLKKEPGALTALCKRSVGMDVASLLEELGHGR